MNTRHLLIIILAIISLISHSSSDYLECTCTGQCHGRDVEQSVTKLFEFWSTSEDEECIEMAQRAYGGHCGGLADCTSGCSNVSAELSCGEAKYYIASGTGSISDTLTWEMKAGDECVGGPNVVALDPCGENCECSSETNKCWPTGTALGSQCCVDWCSGFSGDPPAYFNCLQSCEAGCKTSELTGQLLSVFQYIAVIIAAIMLAVNGLKFITSESPHDRNRAKASIRYIIIALIVLAIVFYMITALFFPVRVPGGDTIMNTCTTTEVATDTVTLPSGAAIASPLSTTPVCSSAYYLRDLGTCKWHDGIDLAVACGTPMVAPATGKVVRAGWVSGYGNTVVINIPDSDVIVFTAHMESVSVSVGDEVAAGSTNIGKSGDTGTPGSCHIHLGTHTGYTSGVPSLDKCCGESCGNCKGSCSQDPRGYFTMFGTCAQNSPCSSTVCYT